MIHKKVLFLFIAFTCSLVYGQTESDSLVIVNTKWETTEVENGMIRKHAQIPLLYNCIQNINIVEFDNKKGKFKTEIVINNPKENTSKSANSHQAIAAINGSYFNIKKGNSTCFLRINKEIIDTTEQEVLNRVNGAINLNKGKVKILQWSKKIELCSNVTKGDIIASGPLMIYNGKTCDFSTCEQTFIKTKHPRTAICLTKDNKLILITIDGRSPKNAEGINIPELSHLLRVLGVKYALNLDGGGSTTLWLKDAPENGVLNMPCDNKKFDHYGERKVSNVIIIKNR